MSDALDYFLLEEQLTKKEWASQPAVTLDGLIDLRNCDDDSECSDVTNRTVQEISENRPFHFCREASSQTTLRFVFCALYNEGSQLRDCALSSGLAFCLGCVDSFVNKSRKFAHSVKNDYEDDREAMSCVVALTTERIAEQCSDNGNNPEKFQCLIYELLGYSAVWFADSWDADFVRGQYNLRQEVSKLFIEKKDNITRNIFPALLLKQPVKTAQSIVLKYSSHSLEWRQLIDAFIQDSNRQTIQRFFHSPNVQSCLPTIVNEVSEQILSIKEASSPLSVQVEVGLVAHIVTPLSRLLESPFVAERGWVNLQGTIFGLCNQIRTLIDKAVTADPDYRDIMRSLTRASPVRGALAPLKCRVLDMPGLLTLINFLGIICSQNVVGPISNILEPGDPVEQVMTDVVLKALLCLENLSWLIFHRYGLFLENFQQGLRAMDSQCTAALVCVANATRNVALGILELNDSFGIPSHRLVGLISLLDICFKICQMFTKSKDAQTQYVLKAIPSGYPSEIKDIIFSSGDIESFKVSSAQLAIIAFRSFLPLLEVESYRAPNFNYHDHFYRKHMGPIISAFENFLSDGPHWKQCVPLAMGVVKELVESLSIVATMHQRDLFLFQRLLSSLGSAFSAVYGSKINESWGIDLQMSAKKIWILPAGESVSGSIREDTVKKCLELPLGPQSPYIKFTNDTHDVLKQCRALTTILPLVTKRFALRDPLGGEVMAAVMTVLLPLCSCPFVLNVLKDRVVHCEGIFQTLDLAEETKQTISSEAKRLLGMDHIFQAFRAVNDCMKKHLIIGLSYTIEILTGFVSDFSGAASEPLPSDCLSSIQVPMTTQLVIDGTSADDMLPAIGPQGEPQWMVCPDHPQTSRLRDLFDNNHITCQLVDFIINYHYSLLLSSLPSKLHLLVAYTLSIVSGRGPAACAASSKSPPIPLPVLIAGATQSDFSSGSSTPASMDLSSSICVATPESYLGICFMSKLLMEPSEMIIKLHLLNSIRAGINEAVCQFTYFTQTNYTSELSEFFKTRDETQKSVHVSNVFLDPIWNVCSLSMTVLVTLPTVLQNMEAVIDDSLAGVESDPDDNDGNLSCVNTLFVSIWNFFRTVLSHGPLPPTYKYRVSATDTKFVDTRSRTTPTFPYNVLPVTFYCILFRSSRAWFDHVKRLLEKLNRFHSTSMGSDSLLYTSVNMLRNVAFSNSNPSDWLKDIAKWMRGATVVAMLEQHKEGTSKSVNDVQEGVKTNALVNESRRAASSLTQMYRMFKSMREDVPLIPPEFKCFMSGQLDPATQRLLSQLNAGNRDVTLGTLDAVQPVPNGAAAEGPPAWTQSHKVPLPMNDTQNLSNAPDTNDLDPRLNADWSRRPGSLHRNVKKSQQFSIQKSNPRSELGDRTAMLGRGLGMASSTWRPTPGLSVAEKLRKRPGHTESAEEMMKQWRQRSAPQNVTATSTKVMEPPGMKVPDQLVNRKGSAAPEGMQPAKPMTEPMLTTAEKEAIWRDCDQFVQNLLRQILEWNFFELEKFDLPELQNIAGRIPITFTNADDFRRYYQPLVLDECRCAIAQELLERKLEPARVKIDSVQTAAGWLTAVIKSAQLRNSGSKSRQEKPGGSGKPEDTDSVPAGALERLPFRPNDLVLFCPASDGDKHPLAGRSLSSIGGPPKSGYWLGVVWKNTPRTSGRTDTTDSGRPELDNRVCCSVQLPRVLPGGATMQVNRLGSSEVSIQSHWVGFALGSLTTSVREFQALYTACFSRVFRYLLDPPKFGISARVQLSEDPSGMSPFMCELRSKNLPGDGNASLASISKQCDLNESQSLAVKHSMCPEHGLALLQGPPGTGKTKTLVAILAAIYQSLAAKTGSNKALTKEPLASKILVCAPSNAAVDEIASRVLSDGLKLPGEVSFRPNCLRVGNPEKITREEVAAISLEAKLGGENIEVRDSVKSERDTEVSKISLRLDELDQDISAQRLDAEARALCAEMSESETGAAESKQILSEKYNERRQLAAKKHRLITGSQDQIKEEIKRRRDALMAAADIFFATLSGSASELLLPVPFGCVVVDEAAQAVELSALIPLRHSVDRLVLIGDPQQLPATVLSKNAKKFSYERSLFQRMQMCGVSVVMLNTQYRMRPQICSFPSEMFYNNRLRNDESVIRRTPLKCHEMWPSLYGQFKFFDVPSTESRHASQSLVNETEADFIVTLLTMFVSTFVGKNKGPNNVALEDIAVVSPYKQQVNVISRKLSEHSKLFEQHSSTPIEVCTIDSFQGREKKIIVFSCVRALGASQEPSSWTGSDDEAEDSSGKSNAAGKEAIQTIGFVADIRRLNVAITRARDALWMVGNGNTLKVHETWAKLIRHAKKASLGTGDARKISYIDVKQVVMKATNQPPGSFNVQNRQHVQALIRQFFSMEEREFAKSLAKMKQLRVEQKQRTAALSPVKSEQKATMIVNQILNQSPIAVPVATGPVKQEMPPVASSPPVASRLLELDLPNGRKVTGRPGMMPSQEVGSIPNVRFLGAAALNAMRPTSITSTAPLPDSRKRDRIPTEEASENCGPNKLKKQEIDALGKRQRVANPPARVFPGNVSNEDKPKCLERHFGAADLHGSSECHATWEPPRAPSVLSRPVPQANTSWQGDLQSQSPMHTLSTDFLGPGPRFPGSLGMSNSAVENHEMRPRNGQGPDNYISSSLLSQGRYVHNPSQSYYHQVQRPRQDPVQVPYSHVSNEHNMKPISSQPWLIKNPYGPVPPSSVDHQYNPVASVNRVFGANSNSSSGDFNSQIK